MSKPEAKYVLAELYESVYRNHTGERTLAHRAYMQGYYWPTMKQNTENYFKRCDWCQRHAPIPRVHSEALSLVTSPWLFAQWGIDIICPLLVAIAQKKFYSLQLTILASGWKQKPMLASKIRMSSSSSRKTSYVDLEFCEQSYNTVFRTFYSKLNIKNLYSTLCYP